MRRSQLTKGPAYVASAAEIAFASFAANRCE